jgi:CRISPR-associated protein Csb2
MLTLEIELLTGVYRASLPDGSRAEWPPHPERVFSALVQAWGDGGRRDDEKATLEWFEALSPPILYADDVPTTSMRDAWTVYVPPNDLRGDELGVMPERRPRQARFFRAVVPDVERRLEDEASPAHVHLAWNVDVTPGQLEALEALAHRVASLGHSASLVRFRFRHEPGKTFDETFDAKRRWRPDPRGPVALRMPYQGRLADLERWFSEAGGKKIERPQSPSTLRYSTESRGAAMKPESTFGGEDDWFIFESVSKTEQFEPDILGLAHITARMRDALLKAAGENAPEILSGHSQPNVPTTRPHVAIVPLLNVGWEHANGDLLGLGVCVPRRLPTEDRRAVLAALAMFSAPAEDDPEAPAYGSLKFRHGTWVLERTASPSRHSLRPARYCAESRVWATVTPLHLDRFPDKGDALEEAEIIAAACRHIGLQEPLSIELHKHSAFRGAPSSYPARGVRHRPDWTFPRESRFKDRLRRHVILTFPETVRGPVILGAGRYHGFGLCLPLHDRASERGLE